MFYSGHLSFSLWGIIKQLSIWGITSSLKSLWHYHKPLWNESV
jgi:hypothetical protein